MSVLGVADSFAHFNTVNVSMNAPNQPETVDFGLFFVSFLLSEDRITRLNFNSNLNCRHWSDRGFTSI